MMECLMEKFNRAVRRHHVSRLKKTRQFYWNVAIRPKSLTLSWMRQAFLNVRGFDHLSPKQLGRVVQTPQVCSCPGCGNARQFSGMTLAEARFHALADAQIEEIE